MTFFLNCQNFSVFPKLLNYNLLHSNAHDTKAIRKRPLGSALGKRESETRKLDQNLSSAKVPCVLSGLNWYIVKRCILRNLRTVKSQVHDKKLRPLAKNGGHFPVMR